jgi:hypothetical protein
MNQFAGCDIVDRRIYLQSVDVGKRFLHSGHWSQEEEAESIVLS